MSPTPTARTLKELKQTGYLAQVVEKWNPWAKIRQDLYGFIDVVAIKAGESWVLGIQCTMAGHSANRMQKAKASPNLAVWLACGNRFEVWGFSKKGPRGERKTWELNKRGVE